MFGKSSPNPVAAGRAGVSAIGVNETRIANPGHRFSFEIRFFATETARKLNGVGMRARCTTFRPARPPPAWDDVPKISSGPPVKLRSILNSFPRTIADLSLPAF